MNIDQIYSAFSESRKITTDTRDIQPGSIFFSLKGENFNGNMFAAKAIEKGCSFAVVDEQEYKIDERFILVKDSLKTLQELANYHRKKCASTFIAITGTNGKTTTKELIAATLGKKYTVFATKGNLNNHIGVPLTLLSITSNTEMAIIEMGASAEGEIAALCKIAEPEYGLITNIGTAHIQGFGSREGVIRAKNELYQYIREHNGTLFLNAGNPLLCKLSDGITRVTYGSDPDDSCRGTFHSSNPFLSFSCALDKASDASTLFDIQTKLIGSYNYENALAAVCIGHFFHVAPSEIRDAICSYSPDNNRSQLLKTKENSILLDAYNANPTSMEAAISNFHQMKGGNKVIIIGEMRELGDISAVEHKKIADMLSELNFQQVYLVGGAFYNTSVHPKFSRFESTDELCRYLDVHKICDSLILVKASRGIKLEKIIPYL